MQNIKSNFIKLICFTLTLGFISSASAAPVYIVLEGTVSASTTTSGLAPTVYNSSVGNTIKIQATWDSDVIFGNNAAKSSTVGSFGSSDGFQADPGGSSVIVTYADQTQKSYATLPLPSYSLTRNNGQASTNYLDAYGMVSGFSDGLGGWKVSLNNENLGNGSHIVLNVNGDTSTASGETEKNGFSLDFTTTTSVLNPDLQTFVWNAALGGSVNGSLSSSWYYSGEENGSTFETIQWNRAVLSYNQADVSDVPLPGSSWLLSSAVLGLVVARKTKTHQQ